ncbi:uncharacterized protein LOC124131114 [Haliotis rufescens]|uniref:uncharacterized protein LOC124131114 n=1 Tax=Haliotis rufescens TaxID=6454 RepID=UPI00201EC470|nr:uncharacterized protein LOC124131114 [Haliotis rufescens]
MHTLYNDKLSNLNNDETGMMPSFPTMSSAWYRHRQKTIPVLPQTRSEVDLQDSWTQTADGRPFLLFADGDDDKILAFGSLESLEALQSSEILYMGGTFTACPGLWNQVYIIHARLGATTYPLIFALLPDRQTDTYSRLFMLLKDEVQQRLNRPLAPSCIQTDFEMAAIRAVQVVFPTADVKGCFFLYCQAIWRKVQHLGLAVAYREDPEVCKWIRRAAGLPLLPKNKIQDTWVDAMDNTPDVPRAVAFNDYILTTWVDHGARFPLPLWNHHSTTGPRMNNNLEGFHNRLNRGLPH